MKKINSIILLSENEKLINLISKKTNESIILLNENIHDLEKTIKNNKKIIVYPIKIENENYEKEKLIFFETIKKNINKIEKIIIDTKEPTSAKVFSNINNEEFSHVLKKDIENILKLLKSYLQYEDKIKILILIHKEKNTKNNFLTLKYCINKFMLELMHNINKNYTNIKINCISTENVNLKYKKNIYPFKKNIHLKKISDLTNACIFILKKNIKNKILIV
ncbi:MAG TPA: hypothetical protein ACYCDA_01335 [Candidatus Azoamicus sp.]